MGYMGTDLPNYAAAGPTMLAAQPSELPISKKNKIAANAYMTAQWDVLRGKLEENINGLRIWRNSWWSHWTLIAKYLLPRRFMWFSGTTPSANSMVRGNPINTAILDPTGQRAGYICAAGLMNGLSSPSRPWFKWKIALPGRDPSEEEQIWFDAVEDRLYAVMAGSNFYDAMAQQKEDLVFFGTGPLIIYEDEQDTIRCYTPGAGEYYLATSSAFRVETLARQFVMTISQIVEMFGLENCPPEVQGLWRTKGASLSVEKIVSHIIEPNFPIDDGTGGELRPVSEDYPWREVYWVFGSGGMRPLSACGFYEQPHVAPRWSTFGNDAYGRSPGMDVLPDVMQLQQETARKAEAIEKMVRPPVVADAQLKNQPSSTLPGGVTFVANLSAATGMRAIYQVEPRIEEMMDDLKEIQLRIQQGFFNDIFMMISQATGDETAYEVAKKYEEKLQVLGPIIERQQNEGHGPAIRRIYRICERKRLIAPIPKTLAGIPLGIEYISIIAVAQRATATAAMERLASMTGNLAAAPAFSDVTDNLDADEFWDEYRDLLSVTAKVQRSKDQVLKLRQGRAQQQAQAQQAQQTQAMVEGAQTLSQTPVDSSNALGKLLGLSSDTPN